MRAWRHAGAYDARRGRVATWLLSITRNLAIDHLRAKRTEPLDPESIRDAEQRHVGDARRTRSARTRATRELRDSLGELPADQRRALLLAALFGFTAREIGEIEEIPLGTAKTRIRTATQKLVAAERSNGEDSSAGRARRRAMSPPTASTLREIAAEVALGIADGEDRAWALDHLAGCPDCRRPDRAALDARRRAAAARARPPSRRPASRPGRRRRSPAAPPRAPRRAGAWRCRSPRRSRPPPAPRPRSGSRSPTTATSPTPTATRSRSPTASTSTRRRWSSRAGRRSATSTATRAAPRGCWRSSTTASPTASYELEVVTDDGQADRRCARMSVADGHGSAGGVTAVPYDRARRGAAARRATVARSPTRTSTD